MNFIKPEQQLIENFLAHYPPDTAVVMLNLLKFAEQANYPAGLEFEPCSGMEAFRRYSEGVLPLIAKHGGEPVWQGRPAAMLIGPRDKEWHLAVLVRYPSARAFVDMVTSHEYQAIAVHRTASLVDSRLLANQEL